ncbi:MAG TPA: molybdenum cofactor biosynthesis protein MoaE [Gemmatimonadaceae bacterium]|nr:molybdenum cofactor biosynthesis protein MoaE [Gemmatimonadaceae bacterium]
MIHVALVREPIDITRLIGRVASHQIGAIAAFLGTVRDVNEGRPVTGIEYSAYEEMAERELLAIAGEASRHSDVPCAVAIEHRLGELSLGDVSVAIVVSHPHRAAALHGCQYVIEELKVRVPIWKREHYADGTRAWVDNRGTHVTSEVIG